MATADDRSRGRRKWLTRIAPGPAPSRKDTGLLPTAARQVETTLDGHEVLAEHAVRALIGAPGLRNR